MNEEAIQELEEYLTNMLNTVIHSRDSRMQSGPFPKWWNSPINNLQPFQCTWWANGRASQYLELTGSKYTEYPTEYGNGVDYYSVNVQNGWFNYGQTPKSCSLISWDDGGQYGHVGFVEAYDPTTDTIYYSHAGGGKSWYGIDQKTGAQGYSYGSGVTCVGFIYLNEPLN